MDHLNENKLDCREKNLRVVTRSENNIRRRPRSDNQSGALGVYRHRRGDFYFQIKRDGAVLSKHGFASVESAAAGRARALEAK